MFFMNTATAMLRQSSLHTNRYGGPSLSLRSREFSYSIYSSNSSVYLEFERKKYFRIHYHQLRYRRHDRASAFSKPRPPTRKKRRAYNRRTKKEAQDRARHSAPGSKAGPKRQWAENRWQQLLTYGKNGNVLLPTTQAAEEEYTYEDAILEDLMANTSYITSQRTPEPVYLGHRHRDFYNRVADKMDVFRETIEMTKHKNEENVKNDNIFKFSNEASESGSDNDDLSLSELAALLPTDQEISKTLRAHRDRHGTRQKPIGIVRALEHLLQDLGVPVSAFKEYTYTTLMTCCQTPHEGRRILKLMRDQNHEISSYSWSILVDIHAKLGDFEGCDRVIKEMISHGYAPTQAAYTSLLAACYKICSDSGRNPHAVRAKAGAFGWKSWQEMRIIGIEPDVMAYGASIRLCAARGLPERAIGLLEDMERFEIKPTTLCFTAALKSVARSHEIANRYQRGSSRRDMKRETIVAHHGKMARQIVILAEVAEVEQDDGFISALMLCAAAAGDSATAKAIHLASEVRKIDNLQTIRGSRSNVLDDRDNDLHLDSRPLSSIETSRKNVKDECDFTQSQKCGKNLPFGEREYGKDTRMVSAFVHSCAQALNTNGIGTIWAGRENLGYLCENSLRLITTRWEPTYLGTSLPKIDSTKIGIGALRRVDEREKDFQYIPGKREKFRGLFIDDDDFAAIDQIRGDNIFGKNNDHSVLDAEQSTNAKYLEVNVSALNDDAIKSGKELFLNNNVVHGQIHSLEVDLLESEKSNSKADMNFSGYSDEVPALLKDQRGQNEKLEFYDKNIPELTNMMQRDYLEMSEGDAKYEISQRNESDEHNVVSSKFNDSIHEHNETSSRQENISSRNEWDKIPNKALTRLEPIQLSKIRYLQRILPGVSLRRVKKILSIYDQTLKHPSLLTLAIIIRDTMPDHLSSSWLKRSNRQNADFALQKAIEDGTVDSSLLNSILEVKAYSGSLNEAIEHHEEQFAKYDLSPSKYSDRLLLQMLIANKRLSRALELKERIEYEGRQLDIASYGSLVQFYSRHQQLGSAILILRECISTHGATPSESYILDFRSLCNRNQLEDLVDLIDIVGGNPNEWVNHGQKSLKRESSKKGRRYVQEAQNRLL